MARSPLTLAALATSAVPGLDVTRAHSFGSNPVTGAACPFDQALLDARSGDRLIVRVPRVKSAETRATGDLVALTALSAGIRSRLPFVMPSVLGQAPVESTRAVVYDFLPGNGVELNRLTAHSGLTASVGAAIAAIHSLPTNFISDAGLPTERAVDSLASTLATMDRASATGLVPAGLLNRWERASEDSALWQFAPVVINGSIGADSILHDGASVTGIVDWQSLSVGDPAKDLFWVLGAADPDAAESVFEAYNHARGSNDRMIVKRARLYAEVEVAKWLLHGTEQRSTEIVDDAVKMLHNLVDLVQNDLSRSIDTDTKPVMTVREVEDMLDRAERTS